MAPLNNGELDVDLGDRGVKGLGRSELWAPGVTGEDSLPLFVSVFNEPKSRLGTVDCLEGILNVDRGDAGSQTWKQMVFNVIVSGLDV